MSKADDVTALLQSLPPHTRGRCRTVQDHVIHSRHVHRAASTGIGNTAKNVLITVMRRRRRTTTMTMTEVFSLVTEGEKD